MVGWIGGEAGGGGGDGFSDVGGCQWVDRIGLHWIGLDGIGLHWTVGVRLTVGASGCQWCCQWVVVSVVDWT